MKKSKYSEEDETIIKTRKHLKKEITKIYPNYDMNKDFILHIIAQYKEKKTADEAFGYVNIFKKDGTTISIEPIVIKPLEDKNWYYMKRSNGDSSTFGVPILFKSFEEIEEIEKIIIKWEFHKEIKKDKENKILVETKFFYQPFSPKEIGIFNERYNFVTYEHIESDIDKFENKEEYIDRFEKLFTAKIEKASKNNYNKIHEIIKKLAMDELSENELNLIKPNLKGIKNKINKNKALDEFVWEITLAQSKESDECVFYINSVSS